MNIHSSAKTCPASRALLVRRIDEEGWSAAEAADAAGVSERTAYKWLARYRADGEAGLCDRSSRPHRMPSRTCAKREALVLKLRRYRKTGPTIARQLRMPRSTVARILKRAGVPRLKDLEPPEPVVRYERQRPGELVHIDIKKLGRFGTPGKRVTGDRRRASRGYGWDHIHVCIDDASRLAYVEVLADETGPTAAGFLQRAARWFRRHGVRIERVMTDNGPGYQSHAFAQVCDELQARHLFTRPYRPCTNGKAERFIQTMLREWAYVRSYPSSKHRNHVLTTWIRHYNRTRPHGSLGGKPPIHRIRSSR